MQSVRLKMASTLAPISGAHPKFFADSRAFVKLMETALPEPQGCSFLSCQVTPFNINKVSLMSGFIGLGRKVLHIAGLARY